MIYYALLTMKTVGQPVKFTSNKYYHSSKYELAKHIVKNLIAIDQPNNYYIHYMKNYHLHSMIYIEMHMFEIVEIFNKKETELVKNEILKLALLK